MMTNPVSRQPLPRTPTEFNAIISEVLSKIPAEYILAVREKVVFLQQCLLSVGRYLQDTASDNEIKAYAAMQLPEMFMWVKAQWLYELSAEDKDFLENIATAYAKGPADPGFPRALVLAKLFLTAYRQEISLDWSAIAPIYMRSFVDYQLESIPLIRPGDGKLYVRHVERTLENLLGYITARSSSRDAVILVLDECMSKFGNNHLMMAGCNLLRIMQLRNKILQCIIAHFDSDVAWTPPPRDPTSKIRIGIISKTMMAGGETWAMLANISAIDRNKYEIVVFFFGHDVGYTHDLDYYRVLGRSVDRIVPLSKSDFKGVVAEIREQDIDILWHQSHFGLMECSHAAFAFTHKLARVECAMIAMHAVTTGNPYFDYFISLEPTLPPKTWDNEFSERELNVKGRLIYIPDKWDHGPNTLVTRQTLNIPADAIVYFGGAAYAKYNADFLAAWLKIIRNVPNSYLVVYPFNPAWTPKAQHVLFYHMRLEYALHAAGVNSDRIRIVGNVNGEAIIHMHGWGHMYLDSFPYGGVTSLNDAIRGGLCPVVSVGQSSLENGDANILASYDLKDLLARSIDEYVEMGIRCGTDEIYRERIRARVRQAWETKRQGFWSQIGTAHAALIEQIVEEKFSDGSSTATSPKEQSISARR